jgi:hypothetical protein
VGRHEPRHARAYNSNALLRLCVCHHFFEKGLELAESSVSEAFMAGGSVE